MRILSEPPVSRAFDWRPYADGLWREVETGELEDFADDAALIVSAKNWAQRNGFLFQRRTDDRGVRFAFLRKALPPRKEPDLPTAEQQATMDTTLRTTADFLRAWAVSDDPEDHPARKTRAYVMGIIAAADRIDPRLTDDERVTP